MHYGLIDLHLSPLEQCFNDSSPGVEDGVAILCDQGSEVFKLSDLLQIQSIDVDGAISLEAELQVLNLLNV